MGVDLTGLVNQLRATLGNMEVALGAIADAIVWTGKNGKVQWCNTAFDKLVNKPHILVLNVKLSDLLPLKQEGIPIAPDSYPDVKVLVGEYEAIQEYEFQKNASSLTLEISGNVADLPGGDKSSVLVIRDVTAAKRWEAERKQAEAILQYRSQVESLLSSISRQFIDQDADIAINFTLEAITKFLEAEHSCIYEYSESKRQFYKVYEWDVAGIESLAITNKKSSIEMFPNFYNQILNGNPVQGLQIIDIPLEVVKNKSLSHQQITQSVVTIPTTLSRKVVGFLELAIASSSKTWSQEEIKFLQKVSELIAIGRARHQAQEALRVAKEAAESANRAKSAFLANMSHELRTPLNAILGFAQLMERDTTLTKRQRDWLSTINRSGEHLLNLINDVLEMSKIEAGRIVLNLVSFDLHQLLQIIQEMFQVRAEAKRLSLQVELAPNLPQYIVTDEGKLRQILINLLGNAIKFTDTGWVTLRVSLLKSQESREASAIGELTDLQRLDFKSHKLLTFEQGEMTIHFEIEDTGKGIAPEELDQLFKPFFQAASDTEVREGTGLGLTISRQFVQLMGDDIRVKSAVNHGSTFYFNIKIELAHSSEVTPPTPKQKAIALVSGQREYRILVVDDRPENCDLLTQLLNTVGFETRAVANGLEAIALWQTWHPQLIWMDMRMPVMNGYEATRQIRALERVRWKDEEEYISSTFPTSATPRTVIIALTASAFEEQRSNILAVGCDDLIRKPFQEEVIFNKIAEYLGVQYIYADKENLADMELIASEPEELKPQDLLVMPLEWVRKLHQAAIQVDADLIIDLIKQIPDTNFSLAEGLTDFVDNFCFDEIIELTQTDS